MKTHDVVNAYDSYAKRNESLREQLKYLDAQNKEQADRIASIEGLLRITKRALEMRNLQTENFYKMIRLALNKPKEGGS